MTMKVKHYTELNNLLAPVCQALSQEAAICGHHHPLHCGVVQDVFLEIIIITNIFVHLCLQPQHLGSHIFSASFQFILQNIAF